MLRLNSPVCSKCVDGLNVQRCVSVEGTQSFKICFIDLFLCCVVFHICPLYVLLLLGKAFGVSYTYKTCYKNEFLVFFTKTSCGSQGSYFLECMALLRFHSFSVPSSDAVSSTAWLG